MTIEIDPHTGKLIIPSGLTLNYCMQTRLDILRAVVEGLSQEGIDLEVIARGIKHALPKIDIIVSEINHRCTTSIAEIVTDKYREYKSLTVDHLRKDFFGSLLIHWLKRNFHIEEFHSLSVLVKPDFSEGNLLQFTAKHLISFAKDLFGAGKVDEINLRLRHMREKYRKDIIVDWTGYNEDPSTLDIALEIFTHLDNHFKSGKGVDFFANRLEILMNDVFHGQEISMQLALAIKKGVEMSIIELENTKSETPQSDPGGFH